MILETAHRLFAAHGAVALPPHAESGALVWPVALWQKVDAAGFPLALLSEDEGGFGLEPGDALCLVRLAAFHGTSLPLGETLLANALFARAHLPVGASPAALVSHASLVLRREGEAWRLQGSAPRVAWARDARVLAVLAHDADGTPFLAQVTTGWTAQPHHNMAAEPRDDVTFDLVLGRSEVSPSPVTAKTLLAVGAVLRAQAMAGAMENILERTVEYANARVQFGKPIGRFQAIQQNLAVMATQVAAARAGADMAADAWSLDPEDADAFCAAAAAAKIRAGEAAGLVAGIAHQTHGAIGFSLEYPLHPFTRRLWAWREEFGAESFWAEHLGAQVCALGADNFWPYLTQSGVRA